MSQIEIPDWVVSKVLDELFPGNSGYVIPNYRDPMKAALRAALEGWLVPVGCIESHELSEIAANRKSSYDLWNIRTYESDDTILYSLRKEPAA